MPPEPSVKDTVAFVDGQNLYHSVRESFGYTYPNYDVVALPRRICERTNWNLIQVRFYTGVPDKNDDPFWHSFWEMKLQAMRWQKVHVYSRSLRYRNRVVKLPDGTEHTFLAGEEKGIDVRISIDVIRIKHRPEACATKILKQVQDERTRFFTVPSIIDFSSLFRRSPLGNFMVMNPPYDILAT